MLENRLKTHSSFSKLQVKHSRIIVAIIRVTTGQLADQRHRASFESSFIRATNYLPSRNVNGIGVTRKNKIVIFFLMNLINHR